LPKALDVRADLLDVKEDVARMKTAGMVYQPNVSTSAKKGE